MGRKILMLIALILIILGLFGFSKYRNKSAVPPSVNQTDSPDNLNGEMNTEPNGLSIENLRKGDYPGSDIKIEETLDTGTNYKRYVASYLSESLKIYGLLTVPNDTPPKGGFPAIIFNHGFIPPAEYRTTEKYVAYQDGFARNGYVTFKSDYRGHGNSEGEPSGAYGSNNYTIDVLNALSSVEQMSYVNKDKVGMWGHSMGGFITLRAMVVRTDIKAGVIWGGVVASYPDLMTRWRRRNVPSLTPSTRGGSWRQTLSEQHGAPEKNPAFWNSISANSYLKDISGPLSLHHGGADESVPPEFSESLEKQMKKAEKTVELFEYPGDDHNISANFSLAEQRSIDFFDKYLK